MKPMMFRPQDLSKLWRIRERRKGSPWSGNMNFRSRVEWYPAGYTPQKKIFAKRFSNLHHFACHSPMPIQKKWKKTYNTFMKIHFGDGGKGSIRYLNKYSCHAWL